MHMSMMVVPRGLTHAHDGEPQHQLAAVQVRDVAEQERAQGAHHEADSEHAP